MGAAKSFKVQNRYVETPAPATATPRPEGYMRREFPYHQVADLAKQLAENPMQMEMQNEQGEALVLHLVPDDATAAKAREVLKGRAGINLVLTAEEVVLVNSVDPFTAQELLNFKRVFSARISPRQVRSAQPVAAKAEAPRVAPPKAVAPQAPKLALEPAAPATVSSAAAPAAVRSDATAKPADPIDLNEPIHAEAPDAFASM